MIMCVLLCYPVSIRIYYPQGVLFLVIDIFYVFSSTMYFSDKGVIGAPSISIRGIIYTN